MSHKFPIKQGGRRKENQNSDAVSLRSAESDHSPSDQSSSDQSPMTPFRAFNRSTLKSRGISLKNHWVWSFLFLGVLFFYGTYSELHNRNRISPVSAQVLTNRQFLITPWDEIASIKIDNSKGIFYLSKAKNGKWTYQGSDNEILIFAKDSIITDLRKLLESIYLKREHSKDDINLSNFVLKKPPLSIEINAKDGPKFQLHFGISNSITGSTYITADHLPRIHEVDILNSPIFSVDASDIIDSRVMNLSRNNVQTVKLEKIVYGKPREIINFKNEAEAKRWVDKRGKEISLEKLDEFFGNLTAVRSRVILDKKTDAIADIIETEMNQPLYRLAITDNLGEKHEFKFSKPISRIPAYNIKEKETLIVQGGPFDYSYVVEAGPVQAVLKVTSKQFKKLSIRKVFY